jgi:predicted nucleic acid-binding protein
MLDAGPLNALLHGADSDHAASVAGFDQLTRAHSIMLAPLPIVFEVYKWLAYETNSTRARSALQQMRDSLQILYPDAAELEDVAALVDDLPGWGGSLEDALVALLGLKMEVPVWTLNYRDLAAFPNLQFWTPGS